jgi:hypothetical protein
MGTPLPASPPITPFAECTCFVQFANKNGDKKIIYRHRSNAWNANHSFKDLSVCCERFISLRWTHCQKGRTRHAVVIWKKWRAEGVEGNRPLFNGCTQAHGNMESRAGLPLSNFICYNCRRWAITGRKLSLWLTRPLHMEHREMPSRFRLDRYSGYVQSVSRTGYSLSLLK